MNTEKATSLTLKCSVAIGIAVIIVGLALFIFNVTDAVLYIGITVLVLSPFIGVIVTTVFLAKEKDWKWLRVAIAFIAVTCIGITISYFF